MGAAVEGSLSVPEGLHRHRVGTVSTPHAHLGLGTQRLDLSLLSSASTAHRPLFWDQDWRGHTHCYNLIPRSGLGCGDSV